MKNIWYDVTEILEWRGHHTGIQRVIHMLGAKLSQDDNYSVRYCRYDRLTKRFIEVDYGFVEHQYEEQEEEEQEEKLVKPSKPPLSVRARIFALGFVPTVFKSFFKQTVKALKVVAYLLIRRSVHFDSGDTLIIPGAFWTGVLPAIEKSKKRTPDLRAVGVIYDLVPLNLPQYSSEVTVKDYNKKSLNKAIRLYDHWLSISENTKKDLLDYTKKQDLELSKDAISTIRLGSDIDVNGPTNPLKIKGKELKNFVLCVGTLEPRKNQYLIYQAVKRSLELGKDLPTILLAGRSGWLSEDLAYMLKNDKSIKGKLLWRQQVDDRTMRWLYKNCMFTLYPSHYEGWGLPVAESLVYGKPCIAARNSSVPEIAGDSIDYVSPHSADDLMQMILKYSSNKDVLKAATKKAQSFRQTTWEETYDQVAKIIGY